MNHMPLTRCWIAIMAVAAVAACAKLDLGGDGPVPTPTSSSPASPTPGACGTPNTNTNLVVVAMGNQISPTSAPRYGTINGYTVVENGSFSSRATLISQWLNQGVLAPITSKNVLQFTNVDTGGAFHSAVGFKGASFPKVPYTFPSAAASPVATAVSTGTLWSTGPHQPAGEPAMLLADVHADAGHLLLWRSRLLQFIELPRRPHRRHSSGAVSDKVDVMAFYSPRTMRVVLDGGLRG